MTADPAIAAAQRAMSNPEVEAAWIDGGNDLAIAAAREALAPLRKKFQQLSEAVLYIDDGTSEGMHAILDAFAPLLYPEDEL
ncbi:hypothetical protein SEA_CLARK_59 [Gordonia phage Clark]|uniref:Uncharacterized protein n=2 Tax=Beenievirus TaxID=3044673 RepID=A0A4Y6EH15_9CAUD|nr:hypothetical protein PP507_gp59 [Gordonia phage Clark]YP_010654533.1 hypothetical protein PP508_gp60 [Gordonia phage Samman98]QDF18008.1 hypothetical protein SEA_CLARK_59 [Gordonia phage Clark]QYC54538.1 hypothetical protein SEA_SAMMAN98_60 [Gordonia phage Samman98]